MDVVRGERNIKWIEEHCYIPDGKFVGRPVRLREWQKNEIRGIYNTPTRRAIISRGRKNGKTAFASFLLLLHLVGPESRINSQLYSDAQSRDQAAILFSLAAKIVRMSPTLSPYVIIKDTAKQLVCPERGTVYKALSAEVSTSYGLSSVFVVHDELGQVRGPHSELYEALETSCGAHDNPLSVTISTQAPTDGDLLSILIDDAIQAFDPKVKLFLYTADDSLDPFSEEAIKAANPAYDDFLNKTEVLEKSETAKRMPSSESSYRNLVLNQRVESNTPFVSKQVWRNNNATPYDYRGKAVYAGLDLASVNDLAALVLTHYEDNAWNINPVFWLPSEGLREKSRADRVPYDVWAKQGFLETTPGASVEFEYVAFRLREIFDECDIQALAFDRWGMKYLKPWLEKAGFSEEELELFVEFGQGTQSMSPALRELESLLLMKKMRHGDHPVLTMCAANARVQTNPAGGRKFTKSKSSGRIDGMVALADAVGVMPETVETDSYVTGRLTIL